MQFSKESDKHSSEALPVIDGRLAELGEAAHAILSTLSMMVPDVRPSAPAPTVVAQEAVAAGATAMAPTVVPQEKPVATPVERPAPVVTVDNKPEVAASDSVAVEPSAEPSFLDSARQQINDAYDNSEAA